MLYTNVIIAVLLCVLANKANVVQGETMLRMLLNNGIVVPGLLCNKKDNALIAEVFERPLTHRQLRSTNNIAPMNHPITYIDEIEQLYDHDEHRHLQFVGSASYCRDQCRGVTSGYCHKTGCTWYNKDRRLKKGYGKGFLSNSTDCRLVADSISADLDYLVSQNMLSTTCSILLSLPRIIECYEDVLLGVVESFRMIDADTDRVLARLLHARETVCNVTSANFQVFVNPCVNTINFTLYNSEGTYNASTIVDATIPGPYSMFGMDGSSKNDFAGEYLPVGNYTLEVTPDGFSNKTRVRNIRIKEC